MLLQTGINDLGGISPISIDEINPKMDWPDELQLLEISKKINIQLKERLPIYPEFINKKNYVSERVMKIIKKLSNKNGYSM